MVDRAWPVLRPMVSSSTAGMPRRVAGQRPPVTRRAPLWRRLRIFQPMLLESLRWAGDGGEVGVAAVSAWSVVGLRFPDGGGLGGSARVPACLEAPPYWPHRKLEASPDGSVNQTLHLWRLHSDTSGRLYHCALDHRLVRGVGPLARRRHMVRRRWQPAVAGTRRGSVTARHRTCHYQPPTSHPPAQQGGWCHVLHRIHSGAAVIAIAGLWNRCGACSRPRWLSPGCSPGDWRPPLDRRRCRDGGGADGADRGGGIELGAGAQWRTSPTPTSSSGRAGTTPSPPRARRSAGGHQVNIQVSSLHGWRDVEHHGD